MLYPKVNRFVLGLIFVFWLLPFDVSAQDCAGNLDLWVANDVSEGSGANALRNNIDQAILNNSKAFLDTVFSQISTTTMSLKGGVVSWGDTATFPNLIEPITLDFSAPLNPNSFQTVYDYDLSLIPRADGNVFLAFDNLIAAINAFVSNPAAFTSGARDEVISSTLIVIGTSLEDDFPSSGITLADKLTSLAAARGNPHILLALFGEAAKDYNNADPVVNPTPNIKPSLDAALQGLESTLLVLAEDDDDLNNSNLPDPANNYVDQLVDAICDINLISPTIEITTNLLNPVTSVSPDLIQSTYSAGIYNNSPARITIDITFPEDVSDFDASDILDNSTAPTLLATNLSGSGANYTFTVDLFDNADYVDDFFVDLTIQLNSVTFTSFDERILRETNIQIQYDTDDDGIGDITEGRGVDIPSSTDTDGDFIPDYIDEDSDSDGIKDRFEIEGNVLDHDGDGIISSMDLDSDNDTILDIQEGCKEGGPLTCSYDSITFILSCEVANPVNDCDQDGDGDSNFLDEDSDNDLIADIIEARNSLDDIPRLLNVDTDGNGIDNAVDIAIQTSETDVNNNDIADRYEVVDIDGDSVPDFLDLDSDNDSLFDVIEYVVQGTDLGPVSVSGFFPINNVFGNDSILDNGTTFSFETDREPEDSDNDLGSDFSLYDFRETESGLFNTSTSDPNDKCVFDIDCSFIYNEDGDLDLNNDGIIDSTTDVDGDGLIDGANDLAIGQFGSFLDFDLDGLEDDLDPDDDNDGIPDSVEGTDDFDSDGFENRFDLDSDGDGILDSVEGFADIDGDSFPNFLDLDSDGDRILDRDEPADANFNFVLDFLEDTSAESISTSSGSGGGAVNPFGLLLLTSFYILRRVNKKRSFVLFKSIVVTAVILIPSLLLGSLSQAHSSDCGYNRIQDPEFQDCWYVGLGGGISFLEPEGSSNGWNLEDDTSTVNSIIVGKHFWSHMFYEFGYADLGEATFKNNNTVQVPEEPELAYKAASFFLGYFLFSENNPFNIYGKVGAVWQDETLTNNSPVLLNIDEGDELNLSTGVGIQYRFKNRPWFIRANYEAYSQNSSFTSFVIGRYIGGRHHKQQSLIVQADSSSQASTNQTSENRNADPVNQQETQSEKIITMDEEAEEMSEENSRTVCKTATIPERIYFSEASAEISDASHQLLARIAGTLLAFPEYPLGIVGYSDSSENTSSLALMRADAVRNLLKAKGVSDERLETIVRPMSQSLSSVVEDKTLLRFVAFEVYCSES